MFFVFAGDDLGGRRSQRVGKEVEKKMGIYSHMITAQGEEKDEW